MSQVHMAKMSQFARRQMEQSGWTHGKGLGKNEDGMAEALKVKIKADNAGIGHDPAEQFTFHWWEHVFTKSAENISVVESTDGVKVATKTETELATTKKKRAIASKKMLYGNFVKSGTLENGRMSKNNSDDSTPSDDSTDSESDSKPEPKILTDEELLAACGGRTAHKGARHGVNLGGKLARLQEQENRTPTLKSKRKKSKKKVEDCEQDEEKESKRTSEICQEKDEKERTKKNETVQDKKPNKKKFEKLVVTNDDTDNALCNNCDATKKAKKKAKKDKRLKLPTDNSQNSVSPLVDAEKSSRVEKKFDPPQLPTEDVSNLMKLKKVKKAKKRKLQIADDTPNCVSSDRNSNKSSQSEQAFIQPETQRKKKKRRQVCGDSNIAPINGEIKMKKKKRKI